MAIALPTGSTFTFSEIHVAPEFEVRSGDFDDEQVISLLEHHVREAFANSPPGLAFVLDISKLQTPDIDFLTIWQGESLVGMGALKHLSDEQCEVKSMRTHPDHLRKGVARFVLETLISKARERGYSLVSLETGTTQEYEPANALYRRFGFELGGVFGDYVVSDFNIYYHLDLSA